MSTIIIAAILISGVISISLFLVSINNKQRQIKTNEFLNHFSKLGTENNLSFSKQEILEHCIIGLDENKRKLLILKQIDEHIYDSLLLNLNEVKSCFKKKIFRGINIGTRKKEEIENQIEAIVLVFNFIDNRPPVHILFFEPITNNMNTIPELDQKAITWEAILTKIVNDGLTKIA